MPKGIEAEVADGFAKVTFTDASLRGPAIQRVLDLSGPTFIDVDTSGTRRRYTILESVAREVGLLDEPETDEKPEPKDAAAKAAAKKAPAKKAAAKKAPAKKAAPVVHATPSEAAVNPFDAGGLVPDSGGDPS
ncbi:MAG: hypothetical protein ACRDGM_08010 [bacterium]